STWRRPAADRFAHAIHHARRDACVMLFECREQDGSQIRSLSWNGSEEGRIPMRGHPLVNRTAWFLGLLLGQTSLLFGLMVALGWLLAFPLIVPTKADAWMTGRGLALPIAPPLIGLVLGLLGLIASRRSHEPIARFSVAGMIFSSVALILAALSILAGS